MVTKAKTLQRQLLHNAKLHSTSEDHLKSLWENIQNVITFVQLQWIFLGDSSVSITNDQI